MEGKVDKSVKLLTTYAGNEGLRFAPANVSTDADFRKFVDLFINSATPAVRQHVAESVYPPIFDGSLPSTNTEKVTNDTVADLIQVYITSFAITGDPNRRGAPYLDVYDGQHVLEMSNESVASILDMTRNPRCDYWHSAPYL